MAPSVATFTDTYLPTVNGVTYTVSTWRERYRDRNGRMAVVYPDADHDPGDDEHPVASLPFPFYEGFRVGLPQIPAGLDDIEVVHTHTPFSVGIAGLRFARRRGCPLVASYHTPTTEYADYLAVGERSERAVRGASRRYERWFLDRADVVLAPSDTTREQLLDTVGVSAPVEVLRNGVDTERFRPVDTAAFRRRHGLPEGPLIGYTGRHGHEKRLEEFVDAAAAVAATAVFGGDGPARDGLEHRARERGVDARFLGFLDRAVLPAFYSALDVFCFPSPVETQGLVALEANACGTPVVAADSGALAETIVDGETGYHFETGDVEAFRAAIRRALARGDRLRERCLDRRDAISVERSVDDLLDLYSRLLL